MKTPIHAPSRSVVLLISCLLVLSATSSVASSETSVQEAEPSSVQTETVQTEPADEAELTRPARSLRVWFDRAPVVEQSSLALVGPGGELQVQGLHTMGEDDLMARVVGPMPDGSYEATYSATFADGTTQSGTWSFEIKRSGRTAP